MDAWGRAEGGGGYSGTGEGAFNWLNTRRGAGANWAQPNFQTGVRNTIGALQDGYYNNIVAALKGGHATAAQLGTMVANSPWGTHDGVLRVLGANPTGFGNAQGPSARNVPSLPKTFSGATAGQSLGITPRAVAGATPSAPYKTPTDVLSALFQGVQNTLSGNPDMSGLLALASSRAQYQAGLSAPNASPTTAAVTPHVSPGGKPEAVSPASGQMTFSGYVNPIPKGSVFERNDQGVDYRTPVGSNIPALGNAKVVRVSNNAGGFGRAIYYQLLDGPQKGKYVYVGHADPLAHAGQYLRAGQAVARSRQVPYGNAAGTPGHIEMGWAGSPYGPLGALGSSNVGSEFFNFLRGLGG